MMRSAAVVRRLDPGLSRTAWLTLTAQFVMNGSTAMVVPFLAVYLAQRLRLAPAAVATVLTTYLLAVRLLPAATGGLGDRAGSRPVVVLGCAARGGGLLAFPLLTSLPALIAAAGLVGLGGALAEPALKGALAAEPEEARASIFAIRNQVLNASFIGGAGVGGALAAVDVTTPFSVSAACFAVLAVAFLVFGPGGRPPRPAGVLSGYRAAARQRGFLLLWAAMVPWWALYAQLNVALPLRAFDLTHSVRQVGLVLVVSGVTGVVLLVPVARLYRALPATTALQLGMALLALSFVVVPLLPGYWWLLACVAVYTVAESTILVGGDLLVAAYAGRGTAATFFGLYATSWAVGGTIGNYVGTWTMSALAGWRPWAVFGLIGLAGLVAAHVHGRLAPGRSRPPA
jgi:MFS family permease